MSTAELALLGALTGATVGGTILDAQAKKASNKEVRRQNSYTRWLADRQNAINEDEYFQDRPMEYMGKKIDLEMKKRSYLDFLRGKGLV